MAAVRLALAVVGEWVLGGRSDAVLDGVEDLGPWDILFEAILHRLLLLLLLFSLSWHLMGYDGSCVTKASW